MIKKLDNTIITPQEEVLRRVHDYILKNGKTYTKFKTTLIRKGIPGELIETIVESGPETSKIVGENEYVVQALTKAKETYVISEVKYKTRYEKSEEEIPQEFCNQGYGCYRPVGEILGVKGYEIMEGNEVWFMTSWGEKMRLLPEDILALPLNLTPEVYRIAWAEFLQTYKEKF